MRAFQLLVSILLVAIVGYTAITIDRHGWDLLPIFFGDIAKMNWPGQFNFDFLGLLILSGLWVSWRHRFSPLGIGLGLLALFGGVLFLSAYLLVASLQSRGNVSTLLLGPGRTR